MRRVKVPRIMTGVIAVSLAAVVNSAAAAPPVPAATSSAGAFARLSPGNQKIVRALFAAQSRTALPPGTHPLTLDQIAAAKHKGEGWGNVFKDMKARGRIADKNLGQVVSRFERQHRTARGPVTNALGRQVRNDSDRGRHEWADIHEGKGSVDGGPGRGSFDSGSRDVASAGASHGSVGGAHGGGRGR